MNRSTMRISEIEIADDRRAVDPVKVKAISESIGAVGLINPVSVDKGGTLVAGAHRIAACRLLGWTEIPVTVLDLDADLLRLAEIDENFIRNELSALERAEQMKERKEIWERLYPETKQGVAGGKAGGSGRPKEQIATAAAATAIPSFSQDASAKTGLSERTIREDVQIAKQLAPDVRDAIRETPLADNRRALVALAAEPAEKQRELVAAGTDAVVEHAREKRASKLTDAERDRLAAMARGNETEEETEETEKEVKPQKVKIGPPCFAMQFARLAVMQLEHIQDDDTEKTQAFEFVKNWVATHEN